MSNEELLKALGRLKVETGSLACLGCGHEHNCSTHGCAILRAAEEALRAPWTLADVIRNMTDDELAEMFADEYMPKDMWLNILRQPVARWEARAILLGRRGEGIDADD